MLQAALEGASAAGHEVDLVFLQAGPWAQELERAGFHVEVLATGRLRHAHRAVAAVVRLARILRRRDPDLIVNWMPKTHLYGAPAALLAGMTDRLVWWQHGIARGEWIDRVVTLLPTRAVGCSSLAAARAQERMWPSRATFVVNPGTRAPTARSNGSPLALPLPPGVPTVGLVGRLQPLKGQDRLLHAQALLRQRGHRIHTVLVGGEAHGLSEEYASSLTPLVERLGLLDDVTMTGQVPDAGPYIEQMDILVNASDPPESFGIVLLEAMARGVPVVAVDSGSPGEFIEDGRTGVLARSADPTALADALQHILESSELRQAIGEAGRARFMEDFTDVAMGGRFWGQLERLARPRRGASDAP